MSVKLRFKTLKDGKKSAWLDVYHRGQRKAEFLNIVLTGNRATDKEMLKVANDQRYRRELELLNEKYKFKKETVNFVSLAEQMAETKNLSTKNLYGEFLIYCLK